MFLSLDFWKALRFSWAWFKQNVCFLNLRMKILFLSSEMSTKCNVTVWPQKSFDFRPGFTTYKFFEALSIHCRFFFSRWLNALTSMQRNCKKLCSHLGNPTLSTSVSRHTWEYALNFSIVFWDLFKRIWMEMLRASQQSKLLSIPVTLVYFPCFIFIFIQVSKITSITANMCLVFATKWNVLRKYHI